MNILAIGAHPDDIEFGCSGTLNKMKELGNKIIFLIMTKGENWEKRDAKIRIDEQKLSCDMQRVDKTYYLDIEDGRITVEIDTIEKIEKIIIENSIKTIFTNDPDDNHQDHRELADIIKSVIKLCDNVFYYETLSSRNFKANMLVNISNEYDYKKNVLRLFHSQILKYEKRGVDYMETIELINKLHGIKSKCKFAEGFYVEKMILNSFCEFCGTQQSYGDLNQI